MYLSCLLIDVGTNPDRPRPGRLWLRNLYRVHQRLCMGFPDDDRAKRDPSFLAPFCKKDFPLAEAKLKTRDDGKQVHVPRAEKNGFLFRVDPQPGGSPALLVQSACQPDWNYAFHNARYLLAAPPAVKPFDPQFHSGQRLRFRLHANATRRASKNSRDGSGQPLDPKWIGKRIPVPAAGQALQDWLGRRAEKAGFRLTALPLARPGYVRVSKAGQRGERQRLFSVLYEGTLKVTDATRFLGSLTSGIGPGKAFGFGLLSVAPYR